ncbi:hypothetical protein LCGC14_1759370 [marine sediment metagenome]|uniref:Uncharacterized protein n=1 Tax=marine sediment metagenome TaxID=412755 RepID=A0A0F9K155_9ZZZZ
MSDRERPVAASKDRVSDAVIHTLRPRMTLEVYSRALSAPSQPRDGTSRQSGKPDHRLWYPGKVGQRGSQAMSEKTLFPYIDPPTPGCVGRGTGIGMDMRNLNQNDVLGSYNSYDI